MSMAEQTVTVGVGALSIEDVIAVARGGAKVAISDESKHEMALSRAVIDHLADDTVPHYGISTGFGALEIGRASCRERVCLYV